MTKTKRPSRPNKYFDVMKFKDSENLDPVRCLDAYLILTGGQRDSKEQKEFLFLSFAEPHHAVKPCTIARWLKLVMQEAGIDISIFKAHSTRAAAVSSVPLAGLSSDEIAKLGNWSNAGTFFRFYKKDVLPSSSEQ